MIHTPFSSEGARAATRREMLKQSAAVGLLASASAGLAELLKVSTAHADSSAVAAGNCQSGIYSPGQCNGGKPCAKGFCCYAEYTQPCSGGKNNFNGYFCAEVPGCPYDWTSGSCC